MFSYLLVFNVINKVVFIFSINVVHWRSLVSVITLLVRVFSVCNICITLL